MRRLRLPLNCVLVIVLLLLGSTAVAQLKIETVAEGLSYPWSLVFLPDGDILVSERSGRLRLISDGKLKPEPVPGLPELFARGEGGLLGLALHPRFQENRWLYFAYVHGDAEQSTVRLGRARYRNGSLSEQQLLYQASPGAGSAHHYGGRVLFDREGYIYLTLGDRGRPAQAQEPSDPLGATVRLTDTGAIPSSNPIGADGRPSAVFAYGNRNAQGMALHPNTGQIWQHEHGPTGGDEINLLRKGANYGWPRVSHDSHPDGRPISDTTEAPDLVAPLHYWDPSIAPSGMTFYQGSEFSGWQGDLFIGALAMRKLVRLELNGTVVEDEEDLLTELGERVRDVTAGPDGALWVLTDSPEGRVLRLTAD